MQKILTWLCIVLYSRWVSPVQVRHLRQVGEGLLVPVRVVRVRHAPVLRGHGAADGAPGGARAPAGAGGAGRRGDEPRVPGVQAGDDGEAVRRVGGAHRVPVPAVRVLPPRPVRQGHGERAVRARHRAAGEAERDRRRGQGHRERAVRGPRRPHRGDRGGHRRGLGREHREEQEELQMNGMGCVVCVCCIFFVPFAVSYDT